MDTQKVRDLSTAQSPKATDFVMLITNLTNNVLEKCQLSALRDILTTNSISDDENNAITTGSDDKLYVPDLTEEIGIIENNLDALNGDVENISNEITVLTEKVYIKEFYDNEENGYVVWSNGYCEQWGYQNRLGVLTTIYLIKKYKRADTYNIHAQLYNTSASMDGRPLLITGVPDSSSYTQNSFSINSYTNYTGFYWRTVGYLADGEY